METAKSLEKIFSENTDGKLVLPNFQRGFEWNINEQKKLLSTVLSLLPIGSILLLEGKKDDFSTRQLCYTDDDFEQHQECLYLLDGQQRTSTLRALFSNLLGDKFNWETNFNKLYSGLRYRWFIDVKKNDVEDIFGYEKLRFRDIREFEPDQFLENIVEKKILKNNRTEWFHPAFEKDENGEVLNGNRLKLAIAKRASEVGWIPLFDIYEAIENPQKSLLYSVLEKISLNRLSELKASTLDNEYSIIDLLEPVSPDIEEHLKNKDIDQINNAWSTLASDWKKDMLDYFLKIFEQKMHVIQLPANEIGRATAIYESINKGGLSLNAYDLLVAKAARVRSERTLTQKIIDMLEENIDLPDSLLDTLRGDPLRTWSSVNMGTVNDKKLSSPIRDQFLNLLSIFSHSDYGEFNNLKLDLIKKEKQLGVTPDQINQNVGVTVKSLLRACAFLQYRCGKINIKGLNYKLMLLPIAYVLKDDEIWNSKEKIAKIEYWYWASLFGGSYRERPNQKCIEDIKELYNWLNGGRNPFTARYERILKNEGYSTLEVLLNKDSENKIPSAIHNGILEYVLSTQPRDFYPDKEILLCAWNIGAEREIEYKDNIKRIAKVEDHHIYPLGAQFTIGESTREIRKKSYHILNSPLNRTLISDYSNNKIRDKSPEQYFSYLSNLTTWRHSIDNIEWKEKTNETPEEKYERLLTSRYNKLLENITIELDNLLHIR